MFSTFSTICTCLVQTICFLRLKTYFLSQALNHVSSYPLLLLSDPLHNFLGVLVPVYKLSTWSALGTSSRHINLKKKKIYQLDQKILQILYLPLVKITVSKQCTPWSEAAICDTWSGTALFAQVPFMRPSHVRHVHGLRFLKYMYYSRDTSN